MIPLDWFDQAERRLSGQIQQTPLTYDPDLRLYLKWENRQRTGSFKIRGALNKVLSLQTWELQRGLVTASAGNHGQGVALAASLVGAPVLVFASHHAVPAKLDAMRALGAEVRLVEGGYDSAERAAQACASQQGLTWISPYNDGQVIAGQATVGLELLAQLAPEVPGTVIVPVGGGGLAAGIGAALERINPRPKLVAVQSTASPFFHQLYHTGTQDGALELESLADGLSGPVEEGSITIPLLRRSVTDFVLVTEAQIAQAIAYAYQKHGEIIEGSGAAALAVALSSTLESRKTAQPVVAIVSGGNIQPQVHAEICARSTAEWQNALFAAKGRSV